MRYRYKESPQEKIEKIILFIKRGVCSLFGHAWQKDKETVLIWHIRCGRCAEEWDGNLNEYRKIK